MIKWAKIKKMNIKPNNRLPNWLNNRAGFSLIEVMFAVIILSVVVFGVVKLQTGNLGLSHTLNHELSAYFWSQQGLSIAEGIDVNGYYENMTDGCSKTSPCTAYIKQDVLTLEYELNKASGTAIETPFSRIIKIEDVNLSIASKPSYKITCIVQWLDTTGNHQIATKRIIY